MPEFQTSVNAFLAPGVKGGWASANPHVSLLQSNTGDLAGANSGAWKVGVLGAIVANFAFADVVTGLVTSAHPGTGAMFNATQAGRVRLGFVQRDQFALITAYLGGDTLALLSGQPVTLISKGDVWAEFAAGAAVGSFVFANYGTGAPVAGATSTPPTTTVAVTTADTSPNLTSVAAGLVAGQPISGTGIPAGTYVVSVDNDANTAVMSAAATATGAITATVDTAALTDWRVDSLAGNGEIAKISVWG